MVCDELAAPEPAIVATRETWLQRQIGDRAAMRSRPPLPIQRSERLEPAPRLGQGRRRWRIEPAQRGRVGHAVKP